MTNKGIIPLSNKLSAIASKAMILPDLKSASLISIEQLCDNNCDVCLNTHILLAVKYKEIILEVTRNQADGLWDILVQKTSIIRNYPPPRYTQDSINIVHEYPRLTSYNANHQLQLNIK